MALIILLCCNSLRAHVWVKKLKKRKTYFLGEQFLQKISNSNRIPSICV